MKKYKLINYLNIKNATVLLAIVITSQRQPKDCSSLAVIFANLFVLTSKMVPKKLALGLAVVVRF